MMWEKVRLGDVFTLIRNGASIKQFDNASGLPITRIETISSTEIDKSKLGYANIVDGEYNDYYLQNGDILMSHINSLAHLGKCALVTNLTEKIIHGMNLLLLRCAEGVLDSKYAKYYFTTPTFKQDVLKISNQSVNQCSFSLNKLKELQIPLPPLPIQKRIAEILDTADALRRKDEALLKKYDELAQAIFIDMFGDPVKNEKGWEVKKLGELTNISSGSTPDRKKPEYYLGNIPWVKTTEVRGEIINNTDENISEDALKNSSCKLHPKGSVIVAMYGQGKTRGQVGLLGIDATTNQACGVIKPNDSFNSIYLFNYLKNSYNELRKLGRGGNQENLNAGMLKDFEIMYPPLELQTKFESIITLFNTQISLINGEQSTNLFNSLLQKAFNGELVA